MRATPIREYFSRTKQNSVSIEAKEGKRWTQSVVEKCTPKRDETENGAKWR